MDQQDSAHEFNRAFRSRAERADQDRGSELGEHVEVEQLCETKTSARENLCRTMRDGRYGRAEKVRVELVQHLVVGAVKTHRHDHVVVGENEQEADY